VREEEYREEEEREESANVVDVGWVSLSRSGRSLTMKVLDEMFFVPLRELYRVLDGDERRTAIKQWKE